MSESMRLSSPSLPPRLLSHGLSPWADRGLISQLSTHFLRLSPSRSHTLLLPLPSVPFSISLPPSIILYSPSLTSMPSISLIALRHFTSTPVLVLLISQRNFDDPVSFVSIFGASHFFLVPSCLPSSLQSRRAERHYLQASFQPSLSLLSLSVPWFSLTHDIFLCFVLYHNDGTSRAICPWLGELCV